MTTVTTDLSLGRPATARPATRPTWPLVLALLGLGACVTDLVLSIGVLGRPAGDDLSWLLSWLVYLIVGAVVVRRRHGVLVGAVLVGAGACVQLSALLDTAAVLAQRHAPTAALAPAAALASGLVFVPALALAGAIVWTLLPSGRLSGPWARRLLQLGVALVGTALLGYALSPGPLDTEPLNNPLGLSRVAWLGPLLLAVSEVGLVVCAAAGVVRLAARYRRAIGDERRALGYLAVGALAQLVEFAAAVALDAAGVAIPTVGQVVARVLLITTLPVAVGLAVVHAHLLDIELVLRRTLTYLLMTAAVVVVYVVTVLVVGDASSHSGQLGTSLLLTGLAAVALSPLRERAQRQVDRLLYGRRADPYGVLRELDLTIARARTPSAVLDGVTSTIAAALKLPYAAIELDGTRYGHGAPRPVARTLPLAHHGRRVGLLLLAPRSPGEDFSALDDRLLSDVADHVAAAVAAVSLADEAQRSRERLVHALEDDRRRIRRDLHDHLGPVLSGITLQLDALRRLTAADPEARDLTTTIRGEVADAVVDVRRLVHDLRPPVLDELGLVEAVRQYADRLAGQLRIEVVADELPALPAAVEVAVYRVATEALTNALRHAAARRALVTIRAAGGRLSLSVGDDGDGIADGAPAGVGLTSMRERVAELGGRISIHAAHPGTVVDVQVPL